MKTKVPQKKKARVCIIPICRQRLFKKRRFLLRKLKGKSNSKANTIKSKVKNIDEEIKTSIDSDRKKEEEEAIENIKENPKSFWQFANSKKKTKGGIGPLVKKDGSLTKDNKEVAEELNQEYKSAWSTPSQEHLIHKPKEFFGVEPQVSGIESQDSDDDEDTEKSRKTAAEDDEKSRKMAKIGEISQNEQNMTKLAKMSKM